MATEIEIMIRENVLTPEDIERLEKKLFIAGLDVRLGVGNEKYEIEKLVDELIIVQNKLCRAIQNKEDFKQKIIRTLNSQITKSEGNYETSFDTVYFYGYNQACREIRRIVKHMI